MIFSGQDCAAKGLMQTTYSAGAGIGTVRFPVGELQYFQSDLLGGSQVMHTKFSVHQK